MQTTATLHRRAMVPRFTDETVVGARPEKILQNRHFCRIFAHFTVQWLFAGTKSMCNSHGHRQQLD